MRSRRVGSIRRQRVLVASTADDETSSDSLEEPEVPETIEVHVHVHHDAAARKKGRPKRVNLTGSLMDWQGHYERVCRKPLPPPKAGGTPLGQCHGCQGPVGYLARSCRVCGAPQPRLVSKVFAAIGLGTVVGVFVICSHVLGGSAQEHRAPHEALGEWTTEEPYIVEVPVVASPFAYQGLSATAQTGLGSGALSANGAGDSSDQVITR